MSQPDEVHALTRSLVDSASAAVGATVRHAAAMWEGCRSAFPETYATHRYVARVRLDASSPDLLAALAPLGLDPAEPDRLRGTHSGLEVSCWALPPGAEGALLLTVRGPCVDVLGEHAEAVVDPLV